MRVIVLIKSIIISPVLIIYNSEFKNESQLSKLILLYFYLSNSQFVFSQNDFLSTKGIQFDPVEISLWRKSNKVYNIHIWQTQTIEIVESL